MNNGKRTRSQQADATAVNAFCLAKPQAKIRQLMFSIRQRIRCAMVISQRPKCCSSDAVTRSGLLEPP
jgi:hypothetical protein